MLSDKSTLIIGKTVKLKLLLLLAIVLALNAVPLRAQNENPERPFIVDPPKVSATEFTNWTKVKITFTVRYLDGYEPEMDLADPHQMSFGLELDPQDGQKLIVENVRKLRKENYKDFRHYRQSLTTCTLRLRPHRCAWFIAGFP